MGIRVFCPCGKRILAGDAMAGKQVRCPDCGDSVPVPGAGEKSTPSTSPFDTPKASSPAKSKPTPPPILPPRVAGKKAHKKQDADDETASPKKTPSASTSSESPSADTTEKPKPKKKKAPQGPAMPPRVAGRKKPPPRPRPKDPNKRPEQPKEQPKEVRTLSGGWVRSFRLPLEPSTRMMLIFWSLLFGFMHGTIQVCIVGLFAHQNMAPIAVLLMAITIPILILCFCFLVHYSLVVLRAATQGERQLPHPNRGESAAFDCFIWFMGFWVSFAPLIFYAANNYQNGVGRNYAGEAVWIGVGLFYLPMALLAACMFDTVRAMNPLTVLVAIARCFVPYTLTVALTGAFLASVMLFNRVMPADIPMVSELVSWFVGIYATVVVMNLLGFVYYHQRMNIGWFTEGQDWHEEPIPKLPSATQSHPPKPTR